MYYRVSISFYFFPVVSRKTLHCTRIQRMPVSSSRANVYTMDEAEAVRICVYHVSPCNCIGSSSRLDCYIVSVGWVRDMVAGYRFSLSSCTSHCFVVSLEWNFCSLQQRTLQDMKMLKEAGSCMGDKNVPTRTCTLFSIYLKKKDTRRDFLGWTRLAYLVRRFE